MDTHASLKFSYLLLMPYSLTMEAGTPSVAPPPPKDAPYFFELDIEFRTLAKKTMVFEDVTITIHPQVLDDQVWIAQCEYALGDTLRPEMIEKKQRLNAYIRQELLRELGYQGDLVEEYAIALVQSNAKSPEAYIKKHSFQLARLLRSSDKLITQEQAGSILKSRVTYSRSDVTIVDWESALVIAEHGDFQSDIDLLKIGNYQLLRYRMLDEEIEADLQSLRRMLTKGGIRWLRNGKQTLFTIVQNRLQLLLDFERTNQSLLLIGDWYSAQLYRVIVEEFYIDDWKKAVSDKLESLSTIDETMRQNLGFSWSRVLDFIQIGGWMVLLMGYFFLFFLEMGRNR